MILRVGALLALLEAKKDNYSTSDGQNGNGTHRYPSNGAD
jgi:hypothetical protein